MLFASAAAALVPAKGGRAAAQRIQGRYAHAPTQRRAPRSATTPPNPNTLQPLIAPVLSDTLDSLGLMQQAMKPFMRRVAQRRIHRRSQTQPEAHPRQ